MGYYRCIAGDISPSVGGSVRGSFNLPTNAGTYHVNLPFQPDAVVINVRNATYFWIFEYPTQLAVAGGTARVGLRLNNAFEVASMTSATITADADGFTFNAAGTGLITTDVINYIAVKDVNDYPIGSGWNHYIPISSSVTSSVAGSDQRFIGSSSYDGSPTTAWIPATSAQEESITYNLGSLKTINGIALSIATSAASDVIATLGLYTSIDGTNFTKIAGLDSAIFNSPWNNQTLTKRTFLSRINATHIKVGLLRISGATSVTAGIGEIEIYG